MIGGGYILTSMGVFGFLVWRFASNFRLGLSLEKVREFKGFFFFFPNIKSAIFGTIYIYIMLIAYVNKVG